MHMDMELTPRLQDIIEILKVKGEVNVQDLALQLKVSPKTAKGYVRNLRGWAMLQWMSREILSLHWIIVIRSKKNS